MSHEGKAGTNSQGRHHLDEIGRIQGGMAIDNHLICNIRDTSSQGEVGGRSCKFTERKNIVVFYRQHYNYDI
jgi:hypothetical protein